MAEAEKFSPDQLVTPRDLQRSMGRVVARLKRHGSLLVLNHGTPIAVLTALPANPSDSSGGGADV